MFIIVFSGYQSNLARFRVQFQAKTKEKQQKQQKKCGSYK